jgi:hypothetical protein
MLLLSYPFYTLHNKSGANISNMSVHQRKAYCMHDAHLVAELVKIKNDDILKIMQVIASHTGLKLEEVCHKGMTGIWTKILNDAISRKVALIGFDNLPSAIRKLYCKNHQSYSEYKQIENDFEEWEQEEENEDEEEDFYYDRKDMQKDDDSWYCEDYITRSIERSKETRIKPLRFEDTLRY